MDIPKEFFPVLLVQIALFLGLWVVLKRLWFDPALKVIAAREARSHGSIAAAEVLHAEAERLRQQHAAAIDEAKAEAQREVQEIMRQAEVEQRRVIGEATEAAQRSLAEVRERVAQEVAAARRDLQADVRVIAREVATVVLGRPV
jgi:F0F1-type ATP synthase membrane subunit b/b'